MANSIGSATVRIGSVAIPVKLFSAVVEDRVSMNQLHKACGGKLKQQLVCPGCGEPGGPEGEPAVEAADIVRGLEYAKGQFVTFTDEELDELQAEKTNTVDVLEFVPYEAIDAVRLQYSAHLGPDLGADRAFRLVARVLKDRARVGVGRWQTKGKEHLALVRPCARPECGGLLLHRAYYANEVRSCPEAAAPELAFTKRELAAAGRLVVAMAPDDGELTALDVYRDEYRARVMVAAAQKAQGVPFDRPKRAVRSAEARDLAETLEASLVELEERPGVASAKPRARAKKSSAA